LWNQKCEIYYEFGQPTWLLDWGNVLNVTKFDQSSGTKFTRKSAKSQAEHSFQLEAIFHFPT